MSALPLVAVLAALDTAPAPTVPDTTACRPVRAASLARSRADAKLAFYRDTVVWIAAPDSRARVYRSEGARTVDQLYAMHSITAAYLAEDTVALREYVGLSDGHGLAVVRGDA